MRSRLPFLSSLAAVLCLSITSFSQTTESDLDAVAKRVISQNHVVGASVLVARGDRILLKKSYGFADLGLEAPTPADAVYHIVGPMLPLTGVAVMQQVERGNLSLNDDIAKFLPDFPLQGHHVTVRQLLSNTSGIVDYHYLGDPLESTYSQPKALDEVVALFANRQWTHEPGTQWDWSVSNFQLLTAILQRVTGQTFEDYMQQNLFAPAGAKATTRCDSSSVIRNLSHSYQEVGNNFEAATEDSDAVSYDLRYCSTVSDLFQLWRAVRRGKLLKPETFNLMSTAEGPGINMTAADPKQHYGLALLLGHEDDHRDMGQNGSLLGYSGSLYEFPADDLTVIVLTNTSGQNAKAIGSALARKVLGIPETPAPNKPAPQRLLADNPTTTIERSQLTGTFQLKVAQGGYHDSFQQYRRTFRVFDEDGHLMIEALGERPEHLLKQADGTFAMRSQPQTPVTFIKPDNRPLTLNLTNSGLTLTGERVGSADVKTFHTLGISRPPVPAFQ